MEDYTKYVRTPGGIIESTQTARRSKVVKYGETIGELCDMFFLEDNVDYVNVPLCTKSLDGIKEHTRIRKNVIDNNISHTREKLGKKAGFKYKYNVYGGICVKGKGLIYVAKMNEKGEFELL